MNNLEYLQLILREIDKLEESLRTLPDHVEPETKSSINALR